MCDCGSKLWPIATPLALCSAHRHYKRRGNCGIDFMWEERCKPASVRVRAVGWQQ